MSSIPLPALDVRVPQQQQNPMEQYAQLLQLKNAMQNAPLQRKILQQNAQAGQLQLQQEQQAQQDQQAFRSAMSDPSMQGKTLGEIADSLAKKGSLSPQTYQQLKKADIEHQQSLATLTKDQLANLKEGHAATQELYNNVMNMPDDQLAQNWPSIAQQYDAIPGNQKMPLNPNQPMTKDQLKQFAPFISMQNSYLDQALERKQKQTEEQTAETELAQKQQELQFGGNQQMADSKYRFLQQKIAAGQPIQPQDQNFIKAYEKQKLLVPQTTAVIREEGYANSREYPVYDSQTKTTLMLPAAEINAANRLQPGRYSVPGYTPEALGAKDTTEYFTKGKGGQQLTTFNTAINHLDTLDKLADDLNNSNLQIANKAKQAWAEQTGSPAPANFAAAKNAMSGEVAAALKASGATDQEITKVGETFNRAQSPAQLKGAIQTYRTLLNSKAQNLHQQYEQGMKGKPNFGNAPKEGDIKTNSHGDKVVFKGGQWQLQQ